MVLLDDSAHHQRRQTQAGLLRMPGATPHMSVSATQGEDRTVGEIRSQLRTQLLLLWVDMRADLAGTINATHNPTHSEHLSINVSTMPLTRKPKHITTVTWPLMTSQVPPLSHFSRGRNRLMLSQSLWLSFHPTGVNRASGTCSVTYWLCDLGKVI